MASSPPKRDSSYYESCPVIFSLNALSKKWLIPVICQLNANSVMRFNELLRSVDGITGMMLTQSLKELQSLGLVNRIQYNEMPLRVEYSLTQTGKDLIPSIHALARWTLNIDGPVSGENMCTNSDCPAHNLHMLSLKTDELESSIHVWDSAYLDAKERIAACAKPMDPIDKLGFFMEYTLLNIAECGEELARLRNIYFLIGDNKSQEFLDERRPSIQILYEVLAEGRRLDIITDDLTDQEIIHAFMAFRHGLASYWELERGIYDISERNHKIIQTFVNGFRKKP